jgi:hypothetical protein
MELLFRLFPKDIFGIPPAVHDEMMEAIRRGFGFLESIAHAVKEHRVEIVPLTSDEVVKKQTLPISFGAGDAECLVIREVRDYTLLTNDRRVRNYCRAEGISVFDLPQLLRALWENRIIAKRRVRRLLEQMEHAENMVIKNKEAIFGPKKRF